MTGHQQPSNTSATLTQRLNIEFALQAAGLGVWELDPVTKQVLWDDRCRQLFGLAKDNPLTHEQASRYIHPDDQVRVDLAVQHALSGQSNGHYDNTFRTVGANDGLLRWVRYEIKSIQYLDYQANDGLLRWVRFIGKAESTPEGQVYRFAGVAQEVTEQALAHQQLEESEARFRSLIEEAPVATCLFVGRELRIEVANQPMIDILGKGQSVFGKPFSEAMPELTGQPFFGILDEVFTTGITYVGKAAQAAVEVDGVLGSYYFDFTYKPLRNAAGQVYAIMLMVADVTQQVQDRQQLEVSEAKLRSVIAAAPSSIGLVVGRDMIIESPNQAFVDIVGKGWDIVGKPVREAMPEITTENQAYLQILEDVYTSGKPFQSYGSLVQVVREGILTNNYYNFSYSPLFDAAGQVYAILSISIDVTGQILAKRAAEESEARYRQLAEHLEEQVLERTEQLAVSNEELAATNEELTATNEDVLAANQALEAANHDLIRSNKNLEQFAYIASHDMQEPLRKIQQFGDLIKSQYEDRLGDGVAYLERMQTAATRMSVLIKDLLAFSRISTTQVITQPVALNQVVSRVLDVLSFVVEESGAQVEVTSLPVVPGDRSQLDQLFQNLLSNAVKFRRTNPVGELVTPQIRIKASLVPRSELPNIVQSVRYAQTYHCIEVADNGIGFEEKYLDRIFQVFQRLHGKNEFAGTGIGLAICEKVVTNHGEAITATSQPSQGATFNVYLPA
jgi:signal transduction histidine kinase